MKIELTDDEAKTIKAAATDMLKFVQLEERFRAGSGRDATISELQSALAKLQQAIYESNENIHSRPN